MTAQDDELVARLQAIEARHISASQLRDIWDAADRLAAQAQEIAEVKHQRQTFEDQLNHHLQEIADYRAELITQKQATDAARQEIAELRAGIAELRNYAHITATRAAAAEAALAEARKDAERYRWLRNLSWGNPPKDGQSEAEFPPLPIECAHHQCWGKQWFDHLDAAIDAEMERQPARTKR